jgi:hypothetical protein
MLNWHDTLVEKPELRKACLIKFYLNYMGKFPAPYKTPNKYYVYFEACYDGDYWFDWCGDILERTITHWVYLEEVMEGVKSEN